MKGKLELTWVGKELRPKLEPRILLEDPEKSYHAERRVSDDDFFDNRLIFGDNLLALKALEQEFAGKVKCVFIDPPYNTGSAFEHYDDGVEHSIWLSLMRDRIAMLRELICDDGFCWIVLDDNEAHYLKVVCDEVFGRSNFIGTVIWEKSDSPRMDALFFSSRHDFLLCYAKDATKSAFQKLAQTTGVPEHYDKVDSDDRRYYLKPLRAMGGQGDSRAARPNLYYGMDAPDGSVVFPIRTDGTDGAWRWSETKVKDEASRIEWVNGRAGWVPYFRIYADTNATRPPETIWFHADVGSNRTSKAEVKALVPQETPFGTPKPEKLVSRILELCSVPGDLVLDSFAGSGTTGAVAQKMNRRWIMVELGEHCHTHIIPRLRKVVDGDDPGGITKAVDWKGGGGFRYYRLAPSLIAIDKYGNEIINPEFNREMLAEAVCKLEGFTYAPSEEVYWQHGRSTDTDFVYITTQTLTHEQLAAISEEVGDERTLLICCAAFRGNPDVFPNLTVKKIPKSVLHKCQWDWNEYEERVKKLGYKAEQLGGLFAEAETEEAE